MGDPSGPESVFLSTPSARRATSLSMFRCPTASDFYPRPPRGGRRLARRKESDEKLISIHALREEGDKPPKGAALAASTFLSTPSARRTTLLQIFLVDK